MEQNIVFQPIIGPWFNNSLLVFVSLSFIRNAVVIYRAVVMAIAVTCILKYVEVNILVVNIDTIIKIYLVNIWSCLSKGLHSFFLRLHSVVVYIWYQCFGLGQ